MPSERLENYCSRFLLKNYWLLGSKMFSCFVFLNKGWLKTFFILEFEVFLDTISFYLT